MNFRKYSKHVIFVAGLISMAALFSRCTSSSGGGGAAATTFAISGNISTGQTAASFSSQKMGAAEATAMSMNDVNAQATQCADGYYYSVYCVSYSEPPVAATGAVTCGGANSGAFTVAGLPLNSEIGCFVRRSSDNTTYSTLGTIQIPTASLTGGTTSIVSQGNLQLAINLNTDGSITTQITGGGSNVASPINANLDTAQYTGFWLLNCDVNASGDLVDPVKCKCQNGGEKLAAYQGGGIKNPSSLMDPETACKTDNASLVIPTNTQQYVEINMYKATPATPLLIDAGVTIPAGTAVPVISVWSASSGTVSSRGAGGEGASVTVKDKNNAPVTLAWSSAQATNPIAWVTSGTHALGNNISVDITTAQIAAAMPLVATTALAWKNWVSALYSNSTGFTCTWGTGGVTDAGCLAEFTERVLHDNRSVNLPSVRIERSCGNSGCDAVVANSRVFVDGYRADYSAITPGTSTNAVNLTSEGVSQQVRNRFVFEPFESSPTGGGFTQHEYRNRGFSCTSAVSGAQLVSKPACNGTNGNFVNCGLREETAIHFKPSSTTAMKIFFENRISVTYASLEKWNTGLKTNGTFTDAMALCNSQFTASEGRFQMTAAKQ